MKPSSLLAGCALLCAALAAASQPVIAQGRGGRAGGPPRTARAMAPQDLSGYWVSVVTEDWRWRMVVPEKGDVASVPLNADARKIADAWDPKKDQASGNQCRSYGAAGLMRVPGRLHLHWTDDSTLQLDTDAGTQTRVFHFGGAAPAGAAQWQGYSQASWEGLGPAAAGRGEDGIRAGHLKVMTTRMRPGYLRKNGIPYSERATLQEYIERFNEPNGDVWLVFTSVVTDPTYLTQPFITTTQFKKIPDGQGWDSTPCRADEPR